MPTQPNPAENMFKELVAKLFERMIRGDYNYDEDMRTLQIYQERVRKLGSLGLEARMLSMMAILNNLVGDVEAAKGKFVEAITMLEGHDDYLEIRPIALYNLGFLLGNLGEYDAALEIYDQGLGMIETPEEMVDMNFTFLTGKMSALVYAQRYDEAETIKPQFAPIAEKFLHQSRREYARRMMYVYLNESRIALAHKDVEKADNIIHLGREFAEQLNLYPQVAEIYLTYARMERIKGHLDEVVNWVNKAEERLKNVQMPVEAARYYLSGARFFLEDGDTLRAKAYAEEAVTLHEKLGAYVGRDLAQAVIDAVENVDVPQDVPGGE